MVVQTVKTTGRRTWSDDGRETIPYRFTVEQYHEMIEHGTLPEGEPYELIDGQIVRKDRSAAGEDPMTVGLEHAWSINALVKLDPKLIRLGCHMRIQLPITLPPYDEPEPDGLIVPGMPNDYLARHPGAADALCVIEVADSSLRRDRRTKQQIYADSGIPQYVIINLPEHVIEVYTQPLARAGRYGQSVTLIGRQQVRFPAPGGKELLVLANRLLPPAP
jgi:Uma2 family endonuclease